LAQSKDIPVEPILKHLFKFNNPHKKCGEYCNPQGHWCLRFIDENPSRIHNAFPDKDQTPEALILSKMKKLIKQNLVSGCPCGCRGDFEITNKGKELIAV
jgi:hypothetical protein